MGHLQNLRTLREYITIGSYTGSMRETQSSLPENKNRKSEDVGLPEEAGGQSIKLSHGEVEVDDGEIKDGVHMDR